MFNFTTVVFDGTSPTFYFTNTSGWNSSSSNVHYIAYSMLNALKTPFFNSQSCLTLDKKIIKHCFDIQA